MGSTLRNAGYQVVIERDGFAALQRLRQTRFRLAVLDLHLPRRTGWEVLQGLQRLAHRPKVMVTTSQQGRLLEQRLRACGCDELLLRPFAPDELLARLERLLPNLN
jgi:DNA-binding response OmpR family regulator